MLLNIFIFNFNCRRTIKIITTINSWVQSDNSNLRVCIIYSRLLQGSHISKYLSLLLNIFVFNIRCREATEIVATTHTWIRGTDSHLWMGIIYSSLLQRTCISQDETTLLDTFILNCTIEIITTIKSWI